MFEFMLTNKGNRNINNHDSNVSSNQVCIFKTTKLLSCLWTGLQVIIQETYVNIPNN